MPEDNLYNIGEAFREMLRQYKLEDKIHEQQIRNLWKKIVGEYCYNATISIKLSNKILTVSINSAAVKHDLLYAKSEIISKLNEYAGEELVNQIKIK